MSRLPSQIASANARPMSSPAPLASDADLLAEVVARAFPGASLARAVALAGDASSRRYVRLHLSGGGAPATAVAMLLPHDAPPTASEEISAAELPAELPFVDVGRFLARHGIAVPEIHYSAEEAGVLLLEDVGDVALADAASRAPGVRAAAHFEAAVETLARIAALAGERDDTCVAFSRHYDRALVAEELAVVSSHGFAAADEGPPRDPCSDPTLDRALARLGDAIAAQPVVLMHRDYHAWNLHLDSRGTLRVIDFQDASLGPALYDLASLCTDRDTDRFVDEELAARLLAIFAEQLSRLGGPRWPDREALRRDYLHAVAYRTLRVIGRFRFLAIEKGKPGYLRFLPRMAKQTRRALAELGDHELLGLLAERSPLFA